jgi:hypothetical protein
LVDGIIEIILSYNRTVHSGCREITSACLMLCVRKRNQESHKNKNIAIFIFFEK